MNDKCLSNEWLESRGPWRQASSDPWGFIGGVRGLGFQLWDAGWLRMLRCESVSAWRVVYRLTGCSLLSFLASCSTRYLQQTPTPPS